MYVCVYVYSYVHICVFVRIDDTLCLITFAGLFLLVFVLTDGIRKEFDMSFSEFWSKGCKIRLFLDPHSSMDDKGETILEGRRLVEQGMMERAQDIEKEIEDLLCKEDMQLLLQRQLLQILRDQSKSPVASSRDCNDESDLKSRLLNEMYLELRKHCFSRHMSRVNSEVGVKFQTDTSLPAALFESGLAHSFWVPKHGRELQVCMD